MAQIGFDEASRIDIATRNRSYTLVVYGEGQALVSGHLKFCSEPVLVQISGCNWAGQC
jgi:hypothetical protein